MRQAEGFLHRETLKDGSELQEGAGDQAEVVLHGELPNNMHKKILLVVLCIKNQTETVLHFNFVKSFNTMHYKIHS